MWFRLELTRTVFRKKEQKRQNFVQKKPNIPIFYAQLSDSRATKVQATLKGKATSNS